MALGAGGIVTDPAINPAYSGTFIKAIETAPPWWQKLCSQRTSTRASEEVAMVGHPPSVRQWLGTRQPGTALENKDTVVHTKYEVSVEIKKDNLEDDISGEIQGVIGGLGTRIANYRNKRVLGDMIDNAEVTTSRWGASALDDQAHFDTDHAWDEIGGSYSTNQDNDLTGAAAATTIPTLAELKGFWRQIEEAFWGFKDDVGEPYFEGDPPERFVAFVPPAYKQVFQELANSNMLPDGSSSSVDNQYKGIIEVIVNMYTANSDKFVVVALDGAAQDMPFLYSQRRDIRLQQVTSNAGTTDFQSFMTDTEYYGADIRFETRFASWLRSIIFTVT